MEGIITQKVTPLLKCFMLFLFIFTAKVLTSRPHESQDVRNGIQHVKPSHYVRTFTKYHHRRTIQWNNHDVNYYWPVTHEQSKVTEKRSITHSDWPQITSSDENKKNIPNSIQKTWPVVRNKRSVIPDSNEFMVPNSNLNRFPDAREHIASFEKNVINIGKMDQNKNGVITNENRKFKVKAAMIVTDPPTTIGPTISCLYKLHSVSISVTPSYVEEKDPQIVVQNDIMEIGPVMETVLPSGRAQVEKCTDPRATCYTLWHQDQEGNVTVLGQGCWRAADTRKGDSPCDKCTRVTARPDTKFCCCTKSYCNADFLSLKEETVTIKAESTMKAAERAVDKDANLYIYLFPMLLLIAMLMMVFLYYDMHCKKRPSSEDGSQVLDVEKGEIMGSGPEALATGLSCVDNLTLIEHIGQGKFGSVWRGTLGSTPVAVKLYSSASTWQKEAAIYSLPHLSHPNILRYYGSDTRQTLTGGYGREHLIVLELCDVTLRARLERAPLSWLEFATLAHGLAAALAHLHTPSGSKPCIVHRDVNSSNVLVTSRGAARLADLGLAQVLQPRDERTEPSKINEAGTLRYLSPEALDGALDLHVAGAALCAVDVFALALVLWEMLWRTRGAHAGPVPPYTPPYADRGLSARPSLSNMQNLVSRNKVRPPLPKGPVPEARALKIAADTCDECWDHDAEARLTAVCVEERMNELKQLVSAVPPRIHDNILHPHANTPGQSTTVAPETDKNSNCTMAQACDVTTPLLYPHPHIGRNACIERNTHTNTQHTVELIHKSLKDITTPIQPPEPRISNEENCLSVARTSHTRIPTQENSLNEIRSYQRPLDYVQNDVSSQDTDRGPKETNLLHDVKVEKPKWGIRRFFERLNKKMETEVKLVPENNQKTRTSIVGDKPINVGYERPSNLVLEERNFNFEAPCLSPPNRTLSPTMMMDDNVLGFKELPPRESDPRTPNQIFAVIVPKAKPSDYEMKNKSKGSSESLNKQSVRTSMSSQSMFKSNSESEDSTVKKRLSCDNKIINSASSSRASINLELQYIDNTDNYNDQVSPFDLNSDCSSSEDEHLMLLSENGGSKITMQTVPKTPDVLKETSQTKAITFNKIQNKYTNFDNEFSDPNDKENLVNGYSGDNPVYLAALKGEIDTADLKIYQEAPKSPKPCLKNLSIKRQHSLEQVSELFSSAGDVNLLNPAGRVKTPGDLPIAVRRARRDRALQKGRASECNRLSLYDDRMMFGNSL